MQLGLIGLGRMGANMRQRIRAGGHEVIGYDKNPAVRDVASLATMVKKLSGPRVVWIMVPAGAPTRDTVAKLAGLLEKGDLVVRAAPAAATASFAELQAELDRCLRRALAKVA